MAEALAALQREGWCKEDIDRRLPSLAVAAVAVVRLLMMLFGFGAAAAATFMLFAFPLCCLVVVVGEERVLPRGLRPRYRRGSRTPGSQTLDPRGETSHGVCPIKTLSRLAGV
jgi:hypothetical protein